MQTFKTDKSELEARFFVAPACYNTWTKLYVLTSDKYIILRIFRLYETSINEAKLTILTRQSNWIDRYLRSKGILYVHKRKSISSSFIQF